MNAAQPKPQWPVKQQSRVEVSEENLGRLMAKFERKNGHRGRVPASQSPNNFWRCERAKANGEAVLKALQDENLGAKGIAEKTGLPIGDVSGALANLKAKGLVTNGQKFSKIVWKLVEPEKSPTQSL